MKILIATKNMAKFDIIARMLKNIFDEKIILNSLNDFEEINDVDEIGNNIERARGKALNAINNLKDNFDAVIGIDDGIIINGEEYAAVKEHLNDIVVGDNVKIGETIYITRAYYLITNDVRESYCYNKIPYIVRKKLKIFDLKGYPLNSVISTIEDDKVLTEKTPNELNEYFLKYSIDDLKNLISVFNKVGD